MRRIDASAGKNLGFFYKKKFLGFKLLRGKCWSQNYDPLAKIRPCERH